MSWRLGALLFLVAAAIVWSRLLAEVGEPQSLWLWRDTLRIMRP